MAELVSGRHRREVSVTTDVTEARSGQSHVV